MNPTTQFLRQLGYTENDKIFFRAIGAKGEARKVEGSFSEKQKELESLNEKGYGIYVVVNGGGHSDAVITQGRALFVEHDNLDKAAQVGLWRSLDLPEPTIQIDTGGKSIHSYWLLDRPCPISDWKTLQSDLLEFADADRSIKNPSRVMRLPGFKHQKTGALSAIINNSGTRYGFNQLRALVPTTVEPAKSAPSPSAVPSGDLPLLVCTAPSTRKAVSDGVGEGGRNDAGAKIARDLIGAAAALQDMGQRYEGDPRQLFDQFCCHCSPPIDGKEADQIWASAEKSQPGASLTDDKIKSCIAAWQKRQQRPSSKGQPKTAGDSGVESETPLMESPWKCMATHNYQLGYWKTEDIHDPSQAEQMMERSKYDRNIEFVSERMAHANGSMPAHAVVTFRLFKPETDFDLKITRIMSSEVGGVTEFEVIQLHGSQVVTRRASVKAEATTKADSFVNALKKSAGVDLSSSASTRAWQALLQNRRAQYRQAGGKTYRLAPRTGRQDDGVWVFENCQFDPDGKLCTEEQSEWAFNSNLSADEQIPSPIIKPQSATAIRDLVKAAKDYYPAETFPLALFAMGHAFAITHRDEILTDLRGFPTLNLFGPAGGGKSLAMALATAPFGMDGHFSTSFSESVLYERAKSLGSLPLPLDDPLKREPGGKTDLTAKVDNFAWGMYDAAARVVRGNRQQPHTSVIVTSNKAIGEGTTAIESRLVKLAFPGGTFNQSAKPALTAAIDNASGGLGQIIALKYDRAAITDLSARLAAHLPNSHDRIEDSLAIITLYTHHLCELAGLEFDAEEYCIKHLCPQSNEYGSDKSGIEDCLGKLASMVTDGQLGDWNCTQAILKNGESVLALALEDIWPLFAKRYPDVNYSRQSIQAEIKSAGGESSKQRFVPQKDTWIQYRKALDAVQRGEGYRDEMGNLQQPKRPGKTALRSCFIIPESAVNAVFGCTDSIRMHFSDNPVTAELETVEVATATPEESPEIKADSPVTAAAQDATMAVVIQAVDGLDEGDEVAMVGEILADANGRQYTAVIAPCGDQVSVWMDGLRVLNGGGEGFAGDWEVAA